MASCLACAGAARNDAVLAQGEPGRFGCPCGPPDKSQFTLFNPTPENLMREMSTDRPDTTESPYTVDAGHVQFELGLVEYINNAGGNATDVVNSVSTNFKVGLLNNVDLQFVFTPYTREETEVTGGESLVDGFGADTQIRLKVNLWGNDGLAPPGLGNTAFAIMPFVQFPTGPDELNNDHVEGGVIFPFAATLPAGFGLGLMAEVDFVYNEDADDYGVAFVHSGTVSHDIVGDLGGYIEYIGIAPHDTGDTYQAIGSAGLTYTLSEDWVVDIGGTASPSDSADDFLVFTGTSFRF